MSLLVVLQKFDAVTVSDSSVVTFQLPVLGYNTARINAISDDAGAAGLIGLFRVDGTNPTDDLAGGEPMSDNQTMILSTKREITNFKFIRYSGYSGNVYLTIQGFIDPNQPAALQVP